MLHERLTDLGTEIPSFVRAARVFQRVTRTAVSEATLRRYTERAGTVLCEVERAAATAAVPTPANPAPPGRLWVLADGAFVRLLHGEWKEVKTLAIGEVQPPRLVKGEMEVECAALSYFSRLAEVDEFIPAATVEIRRRGVDRAKEVGAAADGASWCQRFYDHHCPQAVRVLDFYHGAEYVHDFSKVLYPGSEGAAQWWAGQKLHGLKHEGPTSLLDSLRAWTATGSGSSLGKQAAATLHYFEEREALIQYPAFRAAGWPIGSGAVESANQSVVHDRMKGPGKFWAAEHVNPMLALRNATCSERWDEAWAALTVKMREGRYPVAMLHPKT